MSTCLPGYYLAWQRFRAILAVQALAIALAACSSPPEVAPEALEAPLVTGAQDPLVECPFHEALGVEWGLAEQVVCLASWCPETAWVRIRKGPVTLDRATVIMLGITEDPCREKLPYE